MRVAELIGEAIGTITRREGLPDPVREARWLLARALGRTEAWVFAHADEPVAADAEGVFRAWLLRRAAGEPAHYIVGSCTFWGRPFTVTPAVLIPRPETELIVECALRLEVPARARLLDVGTGCGCLAVTLALDLPGSDVTATDVSLPALAVARRNAAALGAQVRFAAADLTGPLRGPFDLVAANLPYVPEAEIPDLPIEIRAFEPRIALAAGERGTDFLTPLVTDLPRLLAPGGHALIEVGAAQRTILGETITAAGLAEIHRGLDHAGIERVLVLGRK